MDERSEATNFRPILGRTGQRPQCWKVRKPAGVRRPRRGPYFEGGVRPKGGRIPEIWGTKWRIFPYVTGIFQTFSPINTNEKLTKGAHFVTFWKQKNEEKNRKMREFIPDYFPFFDESYFHFNKLFSILKKYWVVFHTFWKLSFIQLSYV